MPASAELCPRRAERQLRKSDEQEGAAGRTQADEEGTSRRSISGLLSAGHTVTDGLCPAENEFILHHGYNAVATEGTAAQRRQVTCQDPERDPGLGDSEASSFLLNSKGLSHFINVSFSLRSAMDQEFSHVLLAPGAYRAAAPGGCVAGDRPLRSWLPEVSGDSCRPPSEFQEWHHVPGVSLRSSKERA